MKAVLLPPAISNFDLISFTIGWIFLPLCMPDNFTLSARHCEFLSAGYISILEVS
jgi:hypothetical protein